MTDDDALRRTAQRYRTSADRFTRFYIASKLRRDPLYAALLAEDRSYGHVVDLGCGRGQLGVLLLEAGLARSVVALDASAAAIAAARQAAAGLPFRADMADLADSKTAVPACDTALLVDVLYQLGRGAAEALLVRAARAARERVLVRALDPDRGTRSRLSLLLERLGRPLWPNSGARVDPLPVPELTRLLEAEGFHVEPAAPNWRGTPFANVLLVARRGAAPPPQPASGSAPASPG